MFVDRLHVPQIQENVQVVTQLSIIELWNQQIQEKYNMIISEEEFKILWIMLIFEDFVMSLLNFLNWYQNSWNMELDLLCKKV